MIARPSGVSIALALVAIAWPVTTASAGLLGSLVDFSAMQVASGFLDEQDPSSSSFTDLVNLEDPAPGDGLDLQGVLPGNRSFLGSLDFTSTTPSAARFDFDFAAATIPFNGTAFEFFFSGGRIDLISTVAFSVTLEALVGGSGGGLAFLYDYDDLAPHLFLPSSDPVSFTIDLEAGTHTIAFGSLVGASGGDADLEGSLTFRFVPAPGAVALLALAGLATVRRRRP